MAFSGPAAERSNDEAADESTNGANLPNDTYVIVASIVNLPTDVALAVVFW